MLLERGHPKSGGREIRRSRYNLQPNVSDIFFRKSGGPRDWVYEEWLDDGYAFHAPVGTRVANLFGYMTFTGMFGSGARISMPDTITLRVMALHGFGTRWTGSFAVEVGLAAHLTVAPRSALHTIRRLRAATLASGPSWNFHLVANIVLTIFILSELPDATG